MVPVLIQEPFLGIILHGAYPVEEIFPHLREVNNQSILNLKTGAILVPVFYTIEFILLNYLHAPAIPKT